jgi:glutamate carboxypeptidase
LDLIERFHERAKLWQGDYLADLERLVNIDSGTFDKAAVDRAGTAFREMLESIGATSTIYPNDDLGDNFVSTLTGEGSRRLMIVGHVDTVYPTGTTSERPFTIQGERAYGPATMDMKGGLVLGYYAVRILREFGISDFAEITFVVNGDEEIGSPTSRDLIIELAGRMDAVLVLEPGRAAGGVLVTRKGVGMYQFDVTGRAAHAGASPKDGRNANLEMAHKVIALHELNDLDDGTTVSVNIVRGGDRRNVIAASAYCEVDVRVSTAHAAERVHSAIQEIASRQTVPDTVTQLSGGLNRPPMERVDGTDALVDIARDIVSRLGLEFRELTSGGGSDGNYTAAAGVPTLDSLGPVGRNAHSVDEYVELDTLPARMALLAALLAYSPARARQG